jgi:hypothetical protein
MKNKIGFFLLVFPLSFITFGCATPNKMYYWGDYSNSLYSCRKQATEENLVKHKQILENIIEESNKNDIRVPPGVYAELGYIYFRQNRNDEALRYFELEARTYPESKVFIQRLSQAAKAKGDIPKSDNTLPKNE